VEVPAGYRVGRWEVLSHIASGSWASVYAARRVQRPRGPHDPPEGARGALKFLPSASLSPAQSADITQASEEVRFNEQTDHPRLIRTFETLVVDDPREPALDGAVVLAMERAAVSLQNVLAATTPPKPIADAARILREICEALVHIHAVGWVHGDLKPSNVLLMEDGTTRVADFGLARELDGTHAYAPRLGTSDFLPPEWWNERIGAQGIAIRPTADIWAFGVTAHQLLTGGMLPFAGLTARARGAAAQAYAQGQAPLRLADELTPPWRALIADCLAPDHAARSRHTAASLLARVGALQEDRRAAPAPVEREPREPLAGPDRPARRRRRSPRRLAAALLLALVGSVAGWALADGERGGGAGAGATVRVFNVEAQCRGSLRADCRLGLARDPYARYAPANVIARVRHGDRLAAECYVPNGTSVGAEDGSSSTVWYRVVTGSRTAWLPGVRAWPGRRPAVARCAS
jgi:serine/threonine-protein kinase